MVHLQLNNSHLSFKFNAQFDIIDYSRDLPDSYLAFMPPEVLKYFSNQITRQELFECSESWSIDVWSLGVIIVEILNGVPVNLEEPTKIRLVNGKSKLCSGIFTGTLDEILAQQIKFTSRFQKRLNKLDCYELAKSASFADLLSKMLHFDPKNRISPLQIKHHDFV